MKFFTCKAVNISRILLLVLTVLSIPFIFIAALFERVGGGRQHLQYWGLAITGVLVFFAYILYQRRVDQVKKINSKVILIISELLIGLTILAAALFSIYAMIAWDFIPPVLIVALGLGYLSALLLAGSINDLKEDKIIVE